MTPVHVKRMGLAALGLSLLTLLVIGLLSNREWRAFRKEATELKRLSQVLQSNGSVLSNLQDAETSQRGFLLTGRQDYLRPYDSAVGQVAKELESLATLAKEDAVTAGRVEALRPLVADKLDELKRTIQVRRTKGLAAALEIVHTDVGKELMDRIRSIALSIDNRQYQARERAWTELEGVAGEVRWLGLLGTILLAGFVAAGAMAMGRAASWSEALQQSERRFRMVADSAPVMIWSETPDGRRDYFNQRWLEFRGRPVTLEMNDGWREGIHPDDVLRYAEARKPSFEVRQPFSLEFRLRRADGSYAWVLSRGIPRMERGQFLGYIGTCVDIDDRKRAEEKLRQTAKLESLGVLAGGIAHDFNNLLVGILGSASLLEEYVPENLDARELLENIQTSSERAAKLTKQMLAYSGRGRFLVGPLDFSALVRQISALIEASMPKNVELRLRLADALPAVEGDASEIQQVVMNLAINAVEALHPSGGIVEISTAAERVEAGAVVDTATAETLAPGVYVALSVSDNGPGIDPDMLPKIFDPFFSTKFTGRGLGLPSVSGIIRGHGGAIVVDTAPGRGTTFRVLCPAAAAASGE